MLLRYFFPRKSYTFTELDKITAHKRGKWTYPYKMYTWLAEQGFEVLHTENFSIRRFAREGESFLKTLWTKQVYDIQKEFSVFADEQIYAQKALASESVTFQKKKGTVELALKYFHEGYFVMLRVNPYALRGEKGSGSHIVVLVDVDARGAVLHDPGLPPRKNLQVSLSQLKAGMYGNNSLVIAVRKRA